MEFSIHEVRLSPYKDTDSTMREIAEFFKEGVESVGKKFKKPTDDWEPVYLAALPDGKGALFLGTVNKHLFVQLVAQFAIDFNAVGIGHLNSSWRWVGKPEDKPEGSIADMPGSEEGLILAIYSRTNWRIEWAPIKRDEKNPPLLGPWEVMMKREEGTEVKGMMFDPLFQALRKN